MLDSSGSLDPPGFFAGLRCSFGGAWRLLRTPRLWLIALVPAVLFVALWFAFWGVAHELTSEWTSSWTMMGSGAFASVKVVLTKALAFVLAVVIATLMAVALAQPLSGPAFDSLVKDKERELGLAERPPSPFFVDMARSLQSLLVSLALGAPATALLALIGFLFPPAVVVTAPLQVFVAALVLAWDMCDLPLSMRGLSVSKRVRLLASHKRAVFGFGLGVWLIQAVPFVVLVVLPAALLGSTELVFRMSGSLGLAQEPTV